MIEKLVYSFKDGDGQDKQLLGGKGANLCEMTQIGINVPPGFVITTKACLDYLEQDQLPKGLMASVKEEIARLESLTSKTFGEGKDPLLVSVRSGSAMSMPGMMDTILNLGLNDETLAGLIEQTGDERFAYDAYRRFIQLFGKVALGIADEHFDKHFDAVKARAGVKADVSLLASHLKEISEKFLDVVHRETGKAFPQDVMVQLELAVEAVFGSWRGKRAVDYRREFHITPEMANGTAVNICTMVFGNKGDDCRDRCERDVRRISYQRSGRGRRGWHSNAEALAEHAGGDAGTIFTAGCSAQHPGVALSGSTGLRVHD